MKNGILLISLAGLLALSMGLIGCGGGGVPEYNLTISSTEGGEITTPGDGTFSYDEGTTAPLVAFPHTGYSFVNWTGDVGTIANISAASTTITVNGDYEIIANFVSNTAIPLKNPDSFVQMTIGDIDSLDPAWVYDITSGAQAQYIYETLLSCDGEEVDQFVPGLATEWELLDDNVTYRFEIRDGVRFHEGGDLTPSDVEYSFERAMVQDRFNGPIWMFYTSLLGLSPRDYQTVSSRDEDGDIQVTFDQIDNAVEVDGDWVVFHLSDSAWGLAFLQILCGPWASIVDKEWCVANGEWDGTEQTWQDYNNPDKADSYLYNHTNGTGPWKLEEWDPGVQIKLSRNDDYWREPAPFETVITKFVEDWATRKEAVLAGDADFVYASLLWTTWNASRLEDIEELEGIADLNVYQDLPELCVYPLSFNMEISSDSEFIGSGALDGDGIPPDFFTDLDVRKGFSYAFDYETYINDGWLGEAQKIGSPICEGLPYFNSDASMYSFDLAKAEEHLKAAWVGEVWEKGFKFTLLYTIGSLPRETACKILAENLHTINPEFQVSLLPTDSPMLPYTRDRLLPMFHVGWAADYPHPDDFVVPFMASYGFFAERQGYGHPELDELIEGAFEELDPVVQKDMYYEIQERCYQDPPGIMLCQPLGRRYFTKYIQGFYYNPFMNSSALPLYYMSKSES